MSPRAPLEGGTREFPETRWTRVLSARSRPEERRALMHELCLARWQPLYFYARQKGLPPDRAEDVVQGLLLRLVEQDFVERLDPSRGTLRGYLKTALKHHLVNLHEHDAAEKRGGDRTRLPIEAAEPLLAQAPADPEAAFDREWALAVLESALAELEREVETGERRGPRGVLRALFGFGEARPYEEIATEHGITVSQVKSFVHRGKRRFRELLLARVADTVATQEEADAELRSLLEALGA